MEPLEFMGAPFPWTFQKNILNKLRNTVFIHYTY